MRNVVFLHKNKDMTNNGFNNHEDNKQETQQKKDEQFMRKALAEAEAAGPCLPRKERIFCIDMKCLWRN